MTSLPDNTRLTVDELYEHTWEKLRSRVDAVSSELAGRIPDQKKLWGLFVLCYLEDGEAHRLLSDPKCDVGIALDLLGRYLDESTFAALSQLGDADVRRQVFRHIQQLYCIVCHAQTTE